LGKAWYEEFSATDFLIWLALRFSALSL